MNSSTSFPLEWEFVKPAAIFREVLLGWVRGALVDVEDFFQRRGGAVDRAGGGVLGVASTKFYIIISSSA